MLEREGAEGIFSDFRGVFGLFFPPAVFRRYFRGIFEGFSGVFSDIFPDIFFLRSAGVQQAFSLPSISPALFPL
jgi:hypothetical protein